MQALTKPTTGHWYWKEDSKTLEFHSYEGAIDKDKPRKSKAIHFQEVGSVLTDSAENKLQAALKSSMGILKSLSTARPSKSTRSSVKRDQEGFITLEDVKQVSLNLLQHHEMQDMPSFSAIVRSHQLDDFLLALLYYLSCYLNRISLEQKPKSLMAKSSAADRKEMSDAVLQTELSQKHLAHMYGILVLGLGMPKQHHLACGRSRGSATHRDRKYFEYLYNFCTYLAWVAFQQKNLDVIQEEIGRLLRSDTFNLILRDKNVPEQQEANMPTEKKKKSHTERRTITRRPAIKSIIHQRSPVLISLLPSPKENAKYLFQYHKVHPSSVSSAVDSKDWINMSTAVISSRIGIIGQPRRMFDTRTLLPLEAEEEAGSRKRSSALLYSLGLDSSYRTNAQSGISRQSIIASRTTTEEGYSENEL